MMTHANSVSVGQQRREEQHWARGKAACHKEGGGVTREQGPGGDIDHVPHCSTFTSYLKQVKNRDRDIDRHYVAMGIRRQVLLLLGALISLTTAEENVTVEARSDTVGNSPFVHEIADKVGVDGPANNNGGGVYMAGKPYINYQATSVDEDDEYNQAVQAARSSNAEPSRNFNSVSVPQNSFPYVTNFNPYGTSAVVTGLYQGQASNNNQFINQEPVQKIMDSKPVGGYTDQQFDGNVNQANFKADSLQQSQNFVDNNNNNNDFVNFNGQQAAFQQPTNNGFAAVSNNFGASQQQQTQQQQNQDFSQQQGNNINNANTNTNNNGQKLTGPKFVTTPQFAYLMAMPGQYPQLLGGANLFGQMPFQGGLLPNTFMPNMGMPPQMAANGFNMNVALKQALAKQQMPNPMAMGMTRNMMGAQLPMAAQGSQMNFNGVVSPNTLSVPMLYGNMGNMANKLSMPYPGAFSPMIFPGQMFMPAMGYNPFFQRNRGKGSSSSSTSTKNKSRSENRDDRDDLEDLFEDDPVDQDSAE